MAGVPPPALEDEMYLFPGNDVDTGGWRSCVFMRAGLVTELGPGSRDQGGGAAGFRLWTGGARGGGGGGFLSSCCGVGGGRGVGYGDHSRCPG
jgi:hypothetical protein